MSDTENRKSMDDVLASIRRIVRSEKDPSEAEAVVDVSEGDAVASDDATTSAAVDEPLALTPDMRMDDEDAALDAEDMATPDPSMFEPTEPEAAVSAEPQPVSASPILATAMAAAAAPVAQGVPDMDIREVVREVLLEELKGDGAAEIVRSILRDELYNGETGSNISQNVMTLIQNEVSKLAS